MTDKLFQSHCSGWVCFTVIRFFGLRTVFREAGASSQGSQAGAWVPAKTDHRNCRQQDKLIDVRQIAAF